jgi:hypothetical protein
MTKVELDAATRAKLHDLSEVVEVCDESGRTLGYFHPIVPSNQAVETEVQPPLSEEELLRRQQQPGGRPLKDILDDLRRA